MRVLIVGGSGTIGRRLTPVLAERHEIIVAARASGDVRVDVTSADSIEAMYRATPGVGGGAGVEGPPSRQCRESDDG